MSTTPPPPVGPPIDTTAPDTAAPDVAAPIAATSAPRPARRSRLGLILGLSLGGAAVLLLAGLGVAFAMVSASHAPSASVSRFLDLVVKGKAHEAGELLAPAPEGDDGLVDDDLYARVHDRITGYRILSTTTHGQQATVAARLTTKAGTWTQRFALVTRHKTLVWDVWTVDGSRFPVVTLADDRPDGVGVTVDGVAIQKDGSSSETFLALPGDYRFAVESDTSLVKADAHEVKVDSFSGRKSVALQVQLTNDGVTKARAAVDAFLDACIAQATIAPTGDCGYEVTNDQGDTLTDIQWSIKQRPVVSFGTWRDGGWDARTDTAGVLVMDAQYSNAREYGDAEAVFDAYDIEGYVSMDASGDITFTSTYKGDDANQPTA